MGVGMFPRCEDLGFECYLELFCTWGMSLLIAAIIGGCLSPILLPKITYNKKGT